MTKEKIERFEDLIAWQKARELTKVIYKVTGIGAFAQDYGFETRFEGLRFRLCLTSLRDSIEVGGQSFIV